MAREIVRVSFFTGSKDSNVTGRDLAPDETLARDARDQFSTRALGAGVQVFATTPPSKGGSSETYLERVTDIARWSDAAGCEGSLIYTDNGLVDPWLVAQHVLTTTERLCPLVAIQPVYMHPYAAAKMVASLGFMYGRRVWLNIVAGGFTTDLHALGDNTPHDARYDRVTEYTQIMLRLLTGETTTFDGRYYRVENLRMTPALPPELEPGVMISGSSPAGFAAAQNVGAIPVKYPQPPHQEEAVSNTTFGIRIGIIARDTEAEAWGIAHERFPEDRRGRITHALAMRTSDSGWHRQLSGGDLATVNHNSAGAGDTYWLGPFHNYKTFCPYLVGEYGQVADLVAGYMTLGARTFILDIPASEDELRHVGVVLRAAAGAAR
jgi:alkanesulfonate monooxygenase